MSQAPLVTVVIPCLNEQDHIESCLRSILAQDYPAGRMEIVVADGGSADGTAAILRRMMGEDVRIRVVDNPDRIQAAGMNAAIRASAGEIIVRVDAHCEYARDYVRRCVETLDRTGAANVGGAQRVLAKTWFQRALRAALASPLGMGGARYRSPDQEGFTDTVFLGAFHRRVLEAVGMYDPRAITNEDAELNQRILERGGRIYLSRRIVVGYYPRDSYAKLARQYYRYGVGRARTLLKHRRLSVVRSVIPFLMLVTGALLCATSPLHPFTPVAFGLYAALLGAFALHAGRSAGIAAIPVVWGIFLVMHVAHGVGFAAGLVRYALHPDWEGRAQLAPRGGGDRSSSERAA